MTQQRSRSKARLLVLAICATLLFAGFLALGTWQVKRLSWKLDLIQRVNQRVHAPAVDAPGPERWPAISAQSDEYRHVRVHGIFLYSQSAFVQAATDYGSGFWLLTPLQSADGSIVLINRGFVSERAKPSDANTAAGNNSGKNATTTVTGLLRISEPGGAFLRSNDAAADRWYSRDVQQIAAARHLSRVAPYFIDADATAVRPAVSAVPIPSDQPVGGLTIIAFHNSHLVYALTWYALALMVAGAFFWLVREERRHRDDDGDGVDQVDQVD
jgi:surfeit locus 1 family protein